MLCLKNLYSSNMLPSPDAKSRWHPKAKSTVSHSVSRRCTGLDSRIGYPTGDIAGMSQIVD